MSKLREFKFKWLDMAMEWDHGEVGKYKAIAYALVVRHMFKGKFDAFPGLPTLAEHTGMSQRTVSTGLDALEAANLIGRKSGGGKGISTFYWLTIPCNMLQGLDDETLQQYRSNLAEVVAKHCKDGPHTLQLFARESELNLFLKQKEPERDRSEEMKRSSPSKVNPEMASPAADNSANIDGKSLPIAPLDMRAAWGDRWPSEAEKIQHIPKPSYAQSSVLTEAMLLLGYSVEESLSLKAPDGHTDFPDYIAATISRENHRKLANLMMEGELNSATLANVMAYYGFLPRDHENPKRERETG